MVWELVLVIIMGIKGLWTVLTPYCERKPIHILRGKVVAIDLAGWVCEGLNVVDYYIHPKQHLKNLFFRTCFLLLEGITPLFVLEGSAPKLKRKVITERSEVHFRGVKPKENPTVKEVARFENRKKFDAILQQCQILLNIMGVECVQGPGEAEAYCAFLNKKGLVDGVISQDSDCFAYGAVQVFRNFSMGGQGEFSQSGSIEIYDMNEISKSIDFGQNKAIAMALFCGCDYCPNGIDGIGFDGVLKLFSMYKNGEILDEIRNWRQYDSRYTELELRVNDKSICVSCGHQGNCISHSKKGCGLCRSIRGCDESLWKEKRLCIKAELNLRKKALSCDVTFPSEHIIKEFLFEPSSIPCLNKRWKKPNIFKFINEMGRMLQWTEIYCFQKFFPILTRWKLLNIEYTANECSSLSKPPFTIKKKRTLKGVPGVEVLWNNMNYKELIPDDQLMEFNVKNPNGFHDLFVTVEPLTLMEQSHPTILHDFFRSKVKSNNKSNKYKKVNVLNNQKENKAVIEGPFHNFHALITATDEIIVKSKYKEKKHFKTSGLQTIDKFLKQNIDKKIISNCSAKYSLMCSTPSNNFFSSDNECDNSTDECFNISNIVSDIVQENEIMRTATEATKHDGRTLFYEPLKL